MQAQDIPHGRTTAELIFTGGQVHTVNARNNIVEAVAVSGGCILGIGSTAEICALARSGTREAALRRRSRLPGFIDAHCHLTGLGMAMVSIDCKAPGRQSIEAFQPPGTWIRGGGYNQTRLRARRHPTRDDRDTVAPNHPVIFTRACGHIASVNSRALAVAGITDQTPDPSGGRYDRDGGRNLGVAYETAQTPLQMAALPTAEEFSAALMRASQAYLAAGCTSVHDAGGLVGPAFGPCQDLVEAGRLKLRSYAFATVNSLQHPVMGLLGAGPRSRFGDERLRLGAFKVITDGSSSGPTTTTREPYTSNDQDCGILYWDQEGLDDLLGRAHRQGFQCTVHAVGDRAIEQTLNAIARAQRECPRQWLRHRIEHCAICLPDLQDRVHAQGIVPVMQPAFFWEFGDGYIQNYGRHRADTMFPVNSLIAAGVPVAGSSDAQVTHNAPLFDIEQGLTQMTMAGDIWGPDERVDLTTAIRLHTIHGAFASFEEGFKGRIEVGKAGRSCPPR